jgi:prepilin-type N-terminal cleavage/methylation domain-containing protein
MTRSRRGFTLIELLVVVVVIGILAVIAIPKFQSTKGKAYFASMRSDLHNLTTAQESFFYLTGKYTTRLDSLSLVPSRGDIVKVTPSSKVVGDLALYMVTNNLSEQDILDPQKHLSFPRSVVEMMQGAIGVPEGGWPKKLQQIVLSSANAQPIRGDKNSPRNSMGYLTG